MWLASSLGFAASGSRRLGILWFSPEAFEDDAKGFFEELGAHGWERRRNLEVIAPYFERPDFEIRPEKAVEEMLAGRPEVVLADGSNFTRAVMRAAPRMPLVVTVADPVGLGFAKTLANPGGTVTGLSQGLREIAAKGTQLLRSIAPRVARIAIISEASEPLRQLGVFTAEACRGAGLEPKLHFLSDDTQVAPVATAIGAGGNGAVLLMANNGSWAKRLATAALASGVPTLTMYPAHVEAGLLLSFRLYERNQGVRFAVMVDRLLRGADPGRIPFELPTLTETVINRRTAAALQLVIPPEILLRADRVIG